MYFGVFSFLHVRAIFSVFALRLGGNGFIKSADEICVFKIHLIWAFCPVFALPFFLFPFFSLLRLVELPPSFGFTRCVMFSLLYR
jgi:hypothetical protein